MRVSSSCTAGNNARFTCLLFRREHATCACNMRRSILPPPSFLSHLKVPRVDYHTRDTSRKDPHQLPREECALRISAENGLSLFLFFSLSLSFLYACIIYTPMLLCFNIIRHRWPSVESGPRYCITRYNVNNVIHSRLISLSCNFNLRYAYIALVAYTINKSIVFTTFYRPFIYGQFPDIECIFTQRKPTRGGDLIEVKSQRSGKAEECASVVNFVNFSFEFSCS